MWIWTFAAPPSERCAHGFSKLRNCFSSLREVKASLHPLTT